LFFLLENDMNKFSSLTIEKEDGAII